MFGSFSIEIEKDEISQVFAESQRDAGSACLVLERRYWGQAVLEVGVVVDAESFWRLFQRVQ